ncbi:DNA methyltransferase [Thiohalocapsa phage LS06-2018-MD03]|nr:DNA methyltransferase [Thiohalocapsa phage LS06-2018-MD03]
MSDKKIILHLCADIGSDSRYYDKSNTYKVIKVGADIGVENFTPPKNVYGVIANPPCTEFSTARASGKARNPDDGMFLVEHCLRVIEECNPTFWVIENPARGVLKKYLGEPAYKYEPWWYGSPWTKQTALWGKFNIPKRKYTLWDDVPKLEGLYVRPNRPKPSLAFMHKSHIKFIPEFKKFKDKVNCDMHFRSLCSQKFAKAFFKVNK